MIFKHAFRWFCHDFTHIQSTKPAGRHQFFPKTVGYATNKVHVEVRTVVGTDIPLQEARELVYDHVPDIMAVYVVLDERHKRGHKAVGLRLTIDSGYDILQGQAVLHGEIRPQVLQLAFDEFGQQHAPQYGTATLIAKDVAQRGDVARYLTIVAQARIASGTQYAGYAFVIAAQCTDGTQQIAINMD